MGSHSESVIASVSDVGQVSSLCYNFFFYSKREMNLVSLQGKREQVDVGLRAITFLPDVPVKGKPVRWETGVSMSGQSIQRLGCGAV